MKRKNQLPFFLPCSGQGEETPISSFSAHTDPPDLVRFGERGHDAIPVETHQASKLPLMPITSIPSGSLLKCFIVISHLDALRRRRSGKGNKTWIETELFRRLWPLAGNCLISSGCVKCDLLPSDPKSFWLLWVHLMGCILMLVLYFNPDLLALFEQTNHKNNK